MLFFQTKVKERQVLPSNENSTELWLLLKQPFRKSSPASFFVDVFSVLHHVLKIKKFIFKMHLNYLHRSIIFFLDIKRWIHHLMVVVQIEHYAWQMFQRLASSAPPSMRSFFHHKVECHFWTLHHNDCKIKSNFNAAAKREDVCNGKTYLILTELHCKIRFAKQFNVVGYLNAICLCNIIVK